MNLFLKVMMGILLFFVTFAFAGTEPWAFSILQYGIFVVALVVAFTSKEIYVTRPLKLISYLLLFLILLALVQSCFPRTLLETKFFYPMTVVPLYTLEMASLFTTYLILIWLVVQIYPSFHSGKRVLLLLSLCGIAVVLCASALVKGDYIFYLVGRRGGFGPFLNRNHAGVFLAMCAVGMLTYFFVSNLEYAKKVTTYQKQSFYIRQTCLALLFLGLSAGVICTRSRGGMLSLAVGIFSYSFLCFWAIPPRLKKRLKGLFFTFLALILVSSWVATHLPEINAFANRATGTSEMTRKMFYRSTFRALKDYPYFGTGLGTTPLVIHNYFEWPIKKYVNYLHCDWLEILLGIGYIGIIPVVILLGWIVTVLLKRLKQLEIKKQFLYSGLLGVMAVMLTGSSVDFDFFIPANAFLFFIIMGLVCSPSYHKGHVHVIHLSWFKRMILVLVCLGAIWIPTRKTMAWRMMLFGKGLKPETQTFVYEKALTYYPSPRYATRLGIAYYNVGVHSKNLELRHAYWRQTYRVADTYLKKYPKDKELSRLYMRTRHVK